MENIVEVLILSLIAIVFLQSGIDKVVDWKGNLSWLNEHFSKSLLDGKVLLALGLVTFLEILSGVTAVVAIGELLFYESACWANFSAVLSAVTFLILFLGQRIAKDYAGAQGIVVYFIPTIFLLYLLQL